MSSQMILKNQLNRMEMAEKEKTEMTRTMEKVKTAVLIIHRKILTNNKKYHET